MRHLQPMASFKEHMDHGYPFFGKRSQDYNFKTHKILGNKYELTCILDVYLHLCDLTSTTFNIRHMYVMEFAISG